MSGLPIAVIGAGPAGMSCANALLSFGLKPVVIERAGQVGGIQRANFHANLWMLGLPGETGIEITERLARHYFELPVATHLNADLRRIVSHPGGFRLELDGDGGTFEVAAVVLASLLLPPLLRGRRRRLAFGQDLASVTLGNTVMKERAVKVRRLADGRLRMIGARHQLAVRLQQRVVAGRDVGERLAGKRPRAGRR